MFFPNEGIDKITLLLQPYMYGYIQGNIKIRKNNKIILYNDQKIVLYKEINSGFIYMTIQCEFIDLCVDMRFTLTNALVRLISNGIVLFGGNEYPDLRYAFIYNYLENFIWLIHDIEFYFNFPRACIEIDAHENDPDIPDSEKDLIHVGTTIYSPDFKKKERTSSIILYDKEHELRVKNQSNHTELENSTRPLRIEFKLYKNNSKYLSLENLKGNYSDIHDISKIQTYATILETDSFTNRNGLSIDKVFYRNNQDDFRPWDFFTESFTDGYGGVSFSRLLPIPYLTETYYLKNKKGVLFQIDCYASEADYERLKGSFAAVVDSFTFNE